MHTMQTTSMKQISKVGHDRNLQKGQDVQYVKNEEKRVITTVEQTAALKHGDIDQGQDQHLHFDLRSRPENIKGLSSKLDPNIVVDTKFISQDPEVRPQTHVGIIKIYKDGTKEYKDVIRQYNASCVGLDYDTSL